MRARVLRSAPLPAVLLLTLLFVLGGCGGSDDDDQPASLSKAEYVKRADEICKETEKQQRKLLTKFQQENKGATGPQVTEEMITAAALPPLEQQAEELAKLPPPDKEAAKADAYVAAVEKAVKDVSKQPGTLLASPGAFTKAEELAPEFGFKTCRGA